MSENPTGDTPEDDTLANYVVQTANGERDWHADDEQHAREQHEEAFGGEPGETIIAVRRLP